MNSQIINLAETIAAMLSDNELGQLSEILDQSPTLFEEAIQEITMVRLPELFKKE